MVDQPAHAASGMLPALGQHATSPVAPSLYLNRELSRLDFNFRVLAQATDPQVPVLERLRFLAIASSNMDEFFEIRVSRLQQQVAYGLAARSHDGKNAQEIMALVSAQAHRLVQRQYQLLREQILPALRDHGIAVLGPEEWSAAQKAWAHQYFVQDVLPVLTPIGLDPAHPFPHVQNKNLVLIVSLDGADAFGRRSGIAVVQLPRALPRVLKLPRDDASSIGRPFALLSAVVEHFVGELFPGMAVVGCVPFRVTRDSDLFVAEEETDDLLEALRGELSRRNDGDAVRLEVGEHCTAEMARFLLSQFELQEADLYRCAGPVNLMRLSALVDLAEAPELRYPAYVPRIPAILQGKLTEGKGGEQRPADGKSPLLQVLRQGPVLLHHPYDSGMPVVELLRQAARDPDVLAIKQTLYRTGASSPFVQALIEAARQGKDVTAVVELRARFDEAANISLATELQEAGANVVYGVVGHKTHAKLILIVRREDGQLRRYVHLGTGNYHPVAARAYTDVSLLSADPQLAEDVHQVFLSLTGLGAARPLQKLWQSPFTLQQKLIQGIAAEAEAARRGQPARIMAKMNALTEPQVIAALYRAAQAGVEIDLIVRGICALRPGVPGVSERIRVRSIVGRYLEHARVWWFGSQDRLYCASADWMERNLHRRVEVAFPIEDPQLAARVRLECLEAALRDSAGAWVLGADGQWTALRDAGGAGFSLQTALMNGDASAEALAVPQL